MSNFDLIKDIRPCDIILVHKKPPYGISDIPAPFIRTLTKCYYNHAGIVGEALGTLYVFQAVGKGFFPTITWDEYIKTIGNEREICILRENNSYYTKSDIYANIDELVGRGYDFKGTLWYQLWYQLFKVWKGPVGEKADDLVFCSEAIAYAYKHRFQKPERVVPADFLKNDAFEMLYESNISERENFDYKYK